MPLKLVLACSAALALLSGAAHAQTRPSGAIGYSAAERRVVDERLARTEETRAALASQLGLSRQLVRSIAFEVGVANPSFSDAQLLDAVASMAERAQQLRVENSRMRSELERLSSPALRDPALEFLDQAEVALEEGRLADAEALYGRLRELRWDESRAAEEAWGAAVEAEAHTSELRQDFVRAQDLRLDASSRILERAADDHRRAFWLADAAASGRSQEGYLFGRKEALQAAISLYDTRVLPMAPRDQYADLWASAQTNLGMALLALGESSQGELAGSSLARAVTVLEAALEVHQADVYPIGWAVTQNILANALMREGEAQGGEAGVALVRRSIGIYQQILDHNVFLDGTITRAMTLANQANSMMLLGEWLSGEEGAGFLDDAIANHTRLLAEFSVDGGDQFLWATTAHNLGVARRMKAERIEREAGLALLAQAAESLNQALQVRTVDQRLSEWVASQMALGGVRRAQALRSDGQEKLSFAREAIRLAELALSHIPDGEMHYYYEGAQLLRGHSYLLLASATEFADQPPIISAAREALEASLGTCDPALPTVGCANAGSALASALLMMSLHEQGEAQATLQAEAIRHVELALVAFPRDTMPFYWAQNQEKLGALHAMIAMASDSDEERRRLLTVAIDEAQEAIDIYSDEGMEFFLSQAISEMAMFHAMLFFDSVFRVDSELGE